MMKTCTACGIEKILDEFYWDRGRPRPMCKLCYNEKQKEWHADARDERVRAMRSRDLKFKYGITLEDFESILESQNGVCAICKQPETRNGRTGKVRHLSVDHNHETFEVRGILCGSCNSLLGMAQENPEILDEAKAYLEYGAQLRLLKAGG